MIERTFSYSIVTNYKIPLANQFSRVQIENIYINSTDFKTFL
jgi:hypothetical protein